MGLSSFVLRALVAVLAFRESRTSVQKHCATNSMRWWQLLLFAQFAHAPSSGPGTGGTSVVLHSTEAVAACQFGTFNVTASPLTSTTYGCAAPSALRAGVAAAPRP